MKILFFVPHLNTIYAGRTIYNGYKNAFVDLGHKFKFLTAEDDHEKIFNEYSPDILFTSMSAYILKFLDLDLIKKQKKKGLKVFVNIPFWKSPISKLRVVETPGISENSRFVNLIKSGEFGDLYYNIAEEEDPRMEGFEKETGYKHYTVPLAADKTLHFYEYSDKFVADISFIGTNSPGKKEFFKHWVFPLKRRYDLRLYGQDWSFYEKLIGFTSKVGMYFNIPFVKNMQKPALELSDERRIYSSSKICFNVHEEYQREFGGDCNERTFKILACGGFEITDDVSCIRKYFIPDKEIVIAKNKKDWFEKIDYYINRPEERKGIIEAGKKRVLKDHTYHNRVEEFVRMYSAL